MTSLEFLNATHAVLIEEFMRPRFVGATQVPGLDLEKSLEAASIWAEGYARPGQDLPPAVERHAEDEVVAQNEAALAQIQAMMGGMTGMN